MHEARRQHRPEADCTRRSEGGQHETEPPGSFIPVILCTKNPRGMAMTAPPAASRASLYMIMNCELFESGFVFAIDSEPTSQCLRRDLP